MDRRSFVRASSAAAGLALLGIAGCRGRQFAHVLDADDRDLVGSHSAGSETYNALIDEAVGKLLGRESEQLHFASQTMPVPSSPKRICFVGVENRTIEELGDFREQLYQLIDSRIGQSEVFEPISRRYVDAALRLTRLKPDDLFIPNNQREFAMTMEQQGAPFDYLLFATLTSGTTQSNNDYQRDYLLTLELVSLHTGTHVKEDAMIRKGYHKTRLGMLRNYNPFSS